MNNQMIGDRDALINQQGLIIANLKAQLADRSIEIRKSCLGLAIQYQAKDVLGCARAMEQYVRGEGAVGYQAPPSITQNP